MRIAFLIRSLRAGGAERQLTLTAAGLAARGHSVAVLVFYEGGPFAADLRAAGVPVLALGKHGRWDLVRFFWSLSRTLASLSPDILYSYLSSSNIVSAVYRIVHPRTLAVWGIRSSVVHGPDDFLKRERQLEAKLGRVPDLIIANSNMGASYAIAKGMPASSIHVVQNGFDVEKFHISLAMGEAFRRAHSIPADAELVGMVAGIRRQKDFTNFVRAAAVVAERRPRARFICIGSGDRVYEAELAGLARELGIGELVTWPGTVDDMPAAYNALDVNCLLSYGESFPNTIAEAMACGTPCVVSDVGDAAEIVDTCGEVVRTNAPQDVADAICRLLAAASPSSRELQRVRVDVRYSLASMIEKTEVLLRGALDTRKAR